MKIPKIVLYILFHGLLHTLRGQSPPIKSSAEQRYPMPSFDLNRFNDTVYVASMINMAHNLLKKEITKPFSFYRDSTILRLYNYLASTYRQTRNNNDSSLFYGKKTMEYAHNCRNTEFEIKGLFQQALYYKILKNNSEEALRLNLKAYRILENSDHDPQVFWRICYNLGDLYLTINEYDNAIKFFKQSDLLVKKGTGLSPLLTEAYIVSIWQGIANMYVKKKQYNLAENYFLKAIEKLKIVSIKSSNAQVYNDYAEFLNEQSRTKEAITYSEKAEKIWIELDDLKGLSTTKSDLALFHFFQNDLETAQKYAEDVIKLKKTSITGLKNAYNVLYKINFRKGEWRNSLVFFEKYISTRDSLESRIRNENLFKIQSRFDMERLELKNLQEKKQQEEKFQNVQNENEIVRLKAVSQFHKFKEQISSEKIKQQIETQVLRELAVKQKTLTFERTTNQEKVINNLKIIELEQNKLIENRTNNALGFGLILTLALISILVWYNRKLNKKNKDLIHKNKIIEEVTNKIAEVEITALRSQMNPHFIFNCLNSIKLYTLENDSEGASEYLTKFSRLIRLVLENSRSERVTLENELETLKLYIEMEAMRFKEKVNYKINIHEAIDTQFTEIPPLLIQPFVENAIWHGLMHKFKGGNVSIDVSLPFEDILEVQVTDDGVGREKANEYKSKTATKHKSFGMEVTNERINLINQLYKTNTRVQIIDLKNELNEAIGTKVIIQIPI